MWAQASCSSEGPRCTPQQRLTLRPEPQGQGSLRPGPGIAALLDSTVGQGGIRAGQKAGLSAGFNDFTCSCMIFRTVGGVMLTLCGGQVECLWDEVLPIEARELPE